MSCNPVRVYINKEDLIRINNEISEKMKRGEVFATNRNEDLIQLLDTTTLALYVITLEQGDKIKSISVF
jgi:hypothetical protein